MEKVIRASFVDEGRALIRCPAMRAIKTHPTKIRTYEDAVKIHGVGEKTALKVVFPRHAYLRRVIDMPNA